MNTKQFLSTIVPAMIVCSCSGIMPGVGILAPASIAGFKMDYSDLHGTYEYTFSADGTYHADIRHSSGPKETPRNGKWIWERKTARDAVLVLDASETLTLRFTTHDHANGTFDGDVRPYAFDFTRM